MVKVTTTWGSLTQTRTIFKALKEKLGREPTNEECRDEVRRILRDAREG
jgi:hypothetical protein